MVAHQASRFLTGDWTSALGDEHGLLCQGYPVILYTLQVGRIIRKYKLMRLFIWIIIFSSPVCREQPSWVWCASPWVKSLYSFTTAGRVGSTRCPWVIILPSYLGLSLSFNFTKNHFKSSFPPPDLMIVTSGDFLSDCLLLASTFSFPFAISHPGVWQVVETSFWLNWTGSELFERGLLHTLDGVKW